nr:hypothetical protein TetV2_00311 [Oceanusvirus sp.]
MNQQLNLEMATGYSLLDEVWGADAMPLPRSSRSKRSSGKKKRKSSRASPLCDREDNRPPVTVADIPGEEHFIPYDPSRYTEIDVLDHSDPLYGAVRPVRKSDENDRGDIFANEENDSPPADDLDPPAPAAAATCPPQRIVQYVSAPRGDDRNDMFLYVFSGVLLLFLLEQFLQIGIHIGARAALSGG